MKLPCKKILRKDLLYKLRGLSSAQRQSFNNAINQHAISLLRMLNFDTGKGNVRFSLYIPQSHEVNIEPLQDYLNAYNQSILYPRIDGLGSAMTFHSVSVVQDWENGPFNIRQPRSSCLAAIPTVLIIPLIGFNTAGYRLGYGKGYYDCYLTNLKLLNHVFVTIGLGYSCQRVAELFQEPHDIPLNYIVTENDVYHESIGSTSTFPGFKDFKP